MRPSMRPWIVLFGGAGREAVLHALREQGIRILKVIVPVRQSERLRATVRELSTTFPDIEAVDRESLGDRLAFAPDAVLLSIGYPYHIPRSVFSRHPLAINLHPTRLPAYRGPTTGAYVIVNAESSTGSTVHLLEDEVDRGAVVAQSLVALTPFDTLRSMQRKVYASEPGLLIEAIQKLDDGVPLQPQDERHATSFPKVRTPEDSRIDPGQPLIDLVHEIRACDPNEFPAYFLYHGQRVCIRLWRPDRTNAADDEL